MQRISEVMTRNVQAVSPGDTIRRAAQIMDELNVGSLPVCDGERLIGMVTDRDITVRAVSAGLAPDGAMVDDVMSTDVRWCFEDQPLDDVMQQMADTQIRRIPVISHDSAHRLVGIVSLGDLATRTDNDQSGQGLQQMVEKISSPSEPDRSAQPGRAADLRDLDRITASNTGTAAGFAGSDVLAERMNPDIEVSSTADPSDIVEVTPENLVNRNAPGSTALNEKRRDSNTGDPESIKVVRSNASGNDTASGGSGATEGADIGVAGASGGTAGTGGSPGTNIGSAP
ncbi:CBS domain-containing protein [Oxalobacteraceae bacterium R-40]|uniref:CBS domain-containing protein n=1 Tax=Keguizhuia sedimenti TaxID=3064264 RepID=A0ABU1BKE7_9BURK|nr:CBS domain-containing protein [Oxalobacteraceae bacterium R-40]